MNNRETADTMSSKENLAAIWVTLGLIATITGVVLMLQR